ncbi:GNAT family N-acetyltransferase [Lachnospiraceae bacterium 45-W7]
MVKIRLAKLDDFDFFYEMKCEDINIFWTGHGTKPERENLYSFFKTAINNADHREARKIYIIEDDGRKVGHLYIIPDGTCFELATAVIQQQQGKGYARKAIALGLDEGKNRGYKKMVTSIREDNIASMKAYTSCGVRVTDKFKMVYIPKLEKEVKMYFVEKELD